MRRVQIFSPLGGLVRSGRHSAVRASLPPSVSSVCLSAAIKFRFARLPIIVDRPPMHCPLAAAAAAERYERSAYKFWRQHVV